MTSELQDFTSLLEAWKQGYKSILRRYFVKKTSSGNELLYALIALTNEDLSKVTEVFVETKDCISGREIEVYTSENLDKMKKDLLAVPNQIHTKQGIFTLPGKADEIQIHIDKSHYPSLTPLWRSPYIKISSVSVNPINQIELDLGLRCADQPYNNFFDLSHSIGGIPADILNGTLAAHIDIVANVPLVDHKIIISDLENLQMSFTFATNFNKKEFQLGLQTFVGQEPVVRTNILGDKFTWTTDAQGHFQASYSTSIPGLEYARVLPMLNGHNIGSEMIADPRALINMRAEMHKGLFPNKPLTDMIHSTNQNEFELGVGILLNTLNLSVINYSVSDNYNDGPDLSAFSSSGHGYIIECTTGTINHKGKLLKLSKRAEAAKQVMNDKRFNTDKILPVIITNQSSDKNHADRTEAGSLKISVITIEDLEMLLTKVNNPPSDNDLFEEALKAIPTTQIANQSSNTIP